jgi:sugar phosphate isomerase/epimerase
MIKLSGRTQPLEHYPCLEALEVIQRLGFEGVEVCLETAEMAPDKLTDETIAAVRERIAALGLAPHVIGYHRDYVYDDREFDLTRRAIVATPAFGAELLLFSGPPKRTADQAEWDRMIARTAELVNLAEKHGVILAQEFEPGFIVGSTAELLRLFEELPSPYLAANADLGHLFLCDPDPIASIHAIGPKIVHGHVENMSTGVHNHELPTEGDMVLGRYFEALHAIGFDGALALDLYRHDYEAVAREQLAYMRALIAAVEKG